MLILTRRSGESIIIGNNITITVLGVKGGQTRLGIDAPREITAHRQEIYLRIKEQQKREEQERIKEQQERAGHKKQQ